MNKYQEALNEMYRKSSAYQAQFNFMYCDEEKAILQELVDKAIQKKPNLLPTLHTFNGSEIEQPAQIIECSCCESWLKPSDKFCSNCGTEIDWSEDES